MNLTLAQIENKLNRLSGFGRYEINDSYVLIMEDEYEEGVYEITCNLKLDKWVDDLIDLTVGRYKSENAAMKRANKIIETIEKFNFRLSVSNC